jgi:hypothetical protein
VSTATIGTKTIELRACRARDTVSRAQAVIQVAIAAICVDSQLSSRVDGTSK